MIRSIFRLFHAHSDYLGDHCRSTETSVRLWASLFSVNETCSVAFCWLQLPKRVRCNLQYFGPKSHAALKLVRFETCILCRRVSEYLRSVLVKSNSTSSAANSTFHQTLLFVEQLLIVLVFCVQTSRSWIAGIIRVKFAVHIRRYSDRRRTICSWEVFNVQSVNSIYPGLPEYLEYTFPANYALGIRG